MHFDFSGENPDIEQARSKCAEQLLHIYQKRIGGEAALPFCKQPLCCCGGIFNYKADLKKMIRGAPQHGREPSSAPCSRNRTVFKS